MNYFRKLLNQLLLLPLPFMVLASASHMQTKTSSSSLTFTTKLFVNAYHANHDIEQEACHLFLAIPQKELVKKFKWRSIWWRSTNYFTLDLHFVPLVLNLVPIALHLIWEIYLYNINECFPIIPFKTTCNCILNIYLIPQGLTKTRN